MLIEYEMISIYFKSKNYFGAELVRVQWRIVVYTLEAKVYRTLKYFRKVRRTSKSLIQRTPEDCELHRIERFILEPI